MEHAESFEEHERSLGVARDDKNSSFLSALQTSQVLHLTKRFQVAVHLSSNRSQMTSKCGKNKKVAHEAIAECVTDVLTTF